MPKMLRNPMMETSIVNYREKTLIENTTKECTPHTTIASLHTTIVLDALEIPTLRLLTAQYYKNAIHWAVSAV